MHCSSTPSLTSATRRSLSRSISRSGRCARGFTGRAGPREAYSRRRRRFSLSRQQELIYMAELDRFQDFRSGVAAPSEDARRRAAARLQGAIEGKHRHGVGAMLLVRRRPGRTVLGLAALATAVGTALFVSAPWKTSPGFLERAQAALTPPAGTILHMQWESGLGSIDPACTITRRPGAELPELCPARSNVCPARSKSRVTSRLDCTWSARGLDRPNAAAQVPHDQGLAERIWRMRTRRV